MSDTALKPCPFCACTDIRRVDQDAETAFLPHIHAPNGRRVIEIVRDGGVGLLPPPKG